jgi:lipoyl-dependent peroxiredoxin
MSAIDQAWTQRGYPPRTNGAGYDVAVRLNVSLPGIAPGVAQRLIEATHEVCPYSRATHGNIAGETKLV